MPDWLQPWLQPTVVIAAVGALFAGIGVLVMRLSVAFVLVMPEVRDTADWWDERRERRDRARGAGGGLCERQPITTSTTESTSPPALRQPRPQQSPDAVRGQPRGSTQLALPLEDTPSAPTTPSSTSTSPIRRTT
jgi:hypothetical protein